MLMTWTLWGQAGLYTVTGNKVNIRSGPGKDYSVISSREKGDTVTVISFYDANWAKIEYGSSFAYMSCQYLSYQGPLPQTEKQDSQVKKASSGWDPWYRIVKAILWLCAIVIIIGGALDTDWGGPALLLQVICGIGALVGWLIFGNAKAGAVIGMGIGIFLALCFVVSQIVWILGGIGRITYIWVGIWFRCHSTCWICCSSGSPSRGARL